MNVATHIDALEREGRLLAESVAGGSLSARVPSCPEWTVEDLVRHVGYVHRWAGAYVGEGITSMVEELSEPEILRYGPATPELVGWFRQGLDDLVATLRSSDPAVECWTFLPAPSPLAFWARRQAHETAIHRADTQLAVGAVGPFQPELAADGIDELLVAFAGRGGGETAGPESRFAVEATDTGDRWVVSVSEEGFRTERGEGDAGCTLAGRASELYLFLWNRQGALRPGSLAVDGDRHLLDSFRQRTQLRWA